MSPKHIRNKVTFRKKGITDIVNLQYKQGVHANMSHRYAFESNNSVFNKNRGPFTNGADAAKLHGLKNQFTHTSMSPKN